DLLAGRRRGRLTRCVAYVLILTFALAVVGPVWAGVEGASSPTATDAAEGGGVWHFFWEVIRNLFNSEELLRTLGRPQYVVAAFIVLNLIVFVETGLLIGFFLPGDSLLVTAGLVCYGAPNWNLPLLLVTLCISAIVGDSVGYYIGYRTGPRIFNREKSFFFNKDHLIKAHQFYEKHGGKTIILAR